MYYGAGRAGGYGYGVERSVVADGVHGFPAALTSFVGRAGVVGEVAALLAEHRLVTVVGPGGAGKTRLAGEVAAVVPDRFEDGVWLAELAAVRDPAQVAVVVAAALGIRDLPPVAAADALAHALARRHMLLVLDNCEHVIGAAAELCGGCCWAPTTFGCWHKQGTAADRWGGSVSAGAADAAGAR